MAQKRDETRADRRKRDTKERFMRYALEEIRKVGYLNFNYGDTARRFGIASSGLYNYFETKEHLFRELLKLVSQNVFATYRAEYGGDVDQAKPIDALVLFGKYVFSMFIKEKHLMDFLFFSPTALRVYSEAAADERMTFDMLNEIHKLIDNVAREYLLLADSEVLLVKWWSFIHGYTLLISAGIIEGNDFYIRDAILDIIAGDNLKGIVDKISVQSSLLIPGNIDSFYHPSKRSESRKDCGSGPQ